MHRAAAAADTSSMSSSVLADFSSVLSRSDSPRSSCASMSSDGDRRDAVTGDAEPGNPSPKAAKGCNKNKRNGGTRLLHASSANGACKRSKRSETAASSSLGDPRAGEQPPPSSSSAIVDAAATRDAFGPAAGDAMTSGLSIMERSLREKARSSKHHHHHHYHSRSTGRKMLEKSFLSAKRDLGTADAAPASLASSAPSSAGVRHAGRKRAVGYKSIGCDHSLPSPMKQDDLSFREASIYSLGQDVMAQVVQFLESPVIHSFLTTPLSKTWLVTYTAPQELWKILCTAKPFHAKLDEGGLSGGSYGGSDASTCRRSRRSLWWHRGGRRRPRRKARTRLAGRGPSWPLFPPPPPRRRCRS